jgi:hypothetical protein
MAGKLLVTEIEAGRTFFDLLGKTGDLRIEAAFWWEEDQEWRFVVSTPIVHEEGRLAAYRKISEAIGGNAATESHKAILDRLDALSPSEGLITVLDVGSQSEVPIRRLIDRESIRGVYVEGAYFYHFAPKTYIAA